MIDLTREVGVSSRTAEAAPERLGVIEPKLMLPRVHPGTLRRGRLLEMLDGHGESPLAMLDAPVGYGTTTLVRSWCAQRPIQRHPDDGLPPTQQLGEMTERLVRIEAQLSHPEPPSSPDGLS